MQWGSAGKQLSREIIQKHSGSHTDVDKLMDHSQKTSASSERYIYGWKIKLLQSEDVKKKNVI